MSRKTAHGALSSPLRCKVAHYASDYYYNLDVIISVGYVQLPHSVHDRYLIVDDDVWLLGSSVKDIGRGLTTIIRTEIDPEYILGCVRK